MDGKDEKNRGIIDISHVAALAKLDLNPSELEHFGSEIDKILGYIGILSEADVSGIAGMEAELEYDRLATGADLTTGFYEDCRLDKCKVDDTFDFGIARKNAPDFESAQADSSGGFFVVPQVIE